jgi:hypothetical protein
MLALRWAALGILSLGCSSGPTPQAVVCVAIDDATLARADTARVRVLDGSKAAVATLTREFATSEPVLLVPLRIPLAAKDGDPSRPFEVEVDLLEGDAVFSRQAIAGGFATGGIHAYDVEFEGACAGVLDCASDQTCRGGSCGPRASTPRQLARDATLDLACPPEVVGSIEGYSDAAQGARNWYYGFYDRSLDVDGTYDPTADFQLLVRNENAWRVEGMFIGAGGETTRIEETHIQGFRGPWERGPDGYHVPIRRFVSPFDGRLAITLTVTDSDVMSDPSDDGLTAIVWVEGAEVLRERVDSAGAHGWPLELDVARGTRIDFAIDAGEVAVYDPTDQTVELRRLD